MTIQSIGRHGVGNTPRSIPQNPTPNPTQAPQRCQHGHCTRDTFEQPRAQNPAQTQAAQQAESEKQGFLQMLQQLLPMLQQLLGALGQGGQQPQATQPTQGS